MSRIFSQLDDCLYTALPVHIELQHERFCLFTVLVMGETVLGIILPPLEQTSTFLATVCANCVLIFSVQYLYFEVFLFPPSSPPKADRFSHSARHARTTAGIVATSISW